MTTIQPISSSYSSRIAKGLGKLAIATAASLPLLSSKETLAEKPATHPTIKNETNIKELLKTKGVTGLVHGSVPGSDLFVFVYGDPTRGGERFSLIPANDDIKAKLQKTSRHQSVTIKGTLQEKGTLQKHILLEDIKLGKVWNPEIKFKYTNQPYSSPEELKKQLEEKKDINCVVHAVLHDGKVLIVNHKGDVIPVHITDPKWTKDLRSSDQINLRYKIRPHTEGPLHVSLKIEDNIPPIKVLDAILPLTKNKEKVTLQGSLVWFPKSPILTRETYGIRVKGSNGLERTFSLFNLTDAKDADKINKILQAAWDKKTEGFIRSTSLFYHPEIKIKVSGRVNHFAVNQRNPLVDLDSQDIKILP